MEIVVVLNVNPRTVPFTVAHIEPKTSLELNGNSVQREIEFCFEQIIVASVLLHSILFLFTWPIP